MSVDFSGLSAERRRVEALLRDMPAIMDQLTVGEGVYAVKQARKICKENGIVNNGTYRMNFHAGRSGGPPDAAAKEYDGSSVVRSGRTHRIDVYNNLDYAQHLEYGFRSHFVPGYWAGHTFVYQPGYPGGMYVGPYYLFDIQPNIVSIPHTKMLCGHVAEGCQHPTDTAEISHRRPALCAQRE